MQKKLHSGHPVTPPRGGWRGASLGNTTKNSSPQYSRGLQPDGFDQNTGEVTTIDPQLARANRWALKSVVNRILPDTRTAKCMVYRAPIAGQVLGDIQIMKGIHQKAFYQGLMRCGSVWSCPICASKVSERRRPELKDAIQSGKDQGMAVHFVSLTIPHGVGDDINVLNDRLSKALKRMSSGKYSVKNQLRALLPDAEIYGYIRALEVTHGKNGFHPHYHLLVFTNGSVDVSVIGYIYGKAWKRACTLSDLPEPSDEHGCIVKDGLFASNYVSKWGLEDEMTKANAKVGKTKGLSPWGLLRAALDGDNPDYPPQRAEALFKVYAAAFAGRRQLFWSVGLRKLLELSSELTDEELAAQAEDERASVLATLTIWQWRAIRSAKQEAHLLTVAESAPALLVQVIDRLVEQHKRRPPRSNTRS